MESIFEEYNASIIAKYLLIKTLTFPSQTFLVFKLVKREQKQCTSIGILAVPVTFRLIFFMWVVDKVSIIDNTSDEQSLYQR